MANDTLAGQFPSTEWTLVLAAGADTSLSAPALEKLCRTYWQPLYAFARRKGHAPEVSEDAVQGFLHTVIARRSIGNEEREGRRFRSWLLRGFGHHLANLYRHDQAARRGGGQIAISIEEAEAALPSDPSLTPDEADDRRWRNWCWPRPSSNCARSSSAPAKARPTPCWNRWSGLQATTPYTDLAAQFRISEEEVRAAFPSLPVLLAPLRVAA